MIDLQAVQSADHRGRGIARYAYELAVALVELRPDLVGPILLNPALPPPGEMEPLVVSGKLAYAGDPDAFPEGAHVFHSLSPFELRTPVEQVWPREASRRGLVLALTLYDLIPEVLAFHYLRDGGPRRRYRTRLQLLRQADRLLAISPAAADQARQRLELPEEAVTVVGTGTSPRFRPPASRDAAAQAARAAVPGLEREFVLYPAGTDFRKNVETLVRAYAELPAELRRRWQLVVSCDMGTQPYAHYTHVSRLLGIEDRVLLTGFVDDDTLLHLYQSAGLVVFPSLAEGYGLPVAEALACGAGVIGSDIAAMEELVEADQRFEPTVGGIAAALGATLRSEERLAELRRRAGRPPATWAEVAARTAAVYEELLRLPRHEWRRRPAVGFVTPLPPAPTGVAHHSLRLAEELARRDEADVDVFADGQDRERYEPVVPAGTECFHARSMPAIEALRGGYERVVYALGNSDNHVAGLQLLRRRPGLVLAHDVRLTNLYAFGAKNEAAVPGGLRGSIERLYGSQLPEWLGAGGRLSPGEEEQYGVLLAREVISLAERYLVSSPAARELALLDAGPQAAGRIGVLPFAAEPPAPGRSGFEERAGEAEPMPPASADPLVAALGIVHEVRQPLRLLEAFALVRRRHPAAQLAYVGPAPEDLRAAIGARAAALGLEGAVTVTGQVTTPCFLEWMRRATVVVQLRDRWNGEASGTVGECLVAGAALVVADIGWMHELPGSCAVKVAAGGSAEELGEAVAALAGDPARLAAMRSAARDFAAAELSFARAAERLAAMLLPGEQPPAPA